MFYTAATLMCGHGSVNKIQRYVLSENTVEKQPQPNRKAVKVTGNVQKENLIASKHEHFQIME